MMAITQSKIFFFQSKIADSQPPFVVGPAPLYSSNIAHSKKLVRKQCAEVRTASPYLHLPLHLRQSLSILRRGLLEHRSQMVGGPLCSCSAGCEVGQVGRGIGEVVPPTLQRSKINVWSGVNCERLSKTSVTNGRILKHKY